MAGVKLRKIKKSKLNTDALKYFKEKKLLFAAWGCENKYFSIIEDWIPPFKRFFEEVIVFDPQANWYRYGKEYVNEKLLSMISEKKPEFVLLYLLNDVFYIDTVRKIKEISPETKIINFFGDDDAQYDSLSIYTVLFSDFNLVAQSKFIKDYIKAGVKNVFFTTGLGLEFSRTERVSKKYDVTFIGTPRGKYRSEPIKYLMDHGVNIKLFGFGWNDYPEFKEIYGGPLGKKEMVDVVKQSKINLSLTKDHSGIPHFKGRVCEMGSYKEFLLVEKSPAFSELFKEGKEIVSFSDYEDLLKKVNYYLKNEPAREKIAEATYDKILNNYHFGVELNNILNEVYKQRNTYPKYLPKIDKKIEKITSLDFTLSPAKIKNKLKNADYVYFSNGKVKFYESKNYFQLYSLILNKKPISVCDYYVHSKRLGNYLVSKMYPKIHSLPDRDDLTPMMNINQLMVEKDYFFNNLIKFKKLMSGEKINLLNLENSTFISIPLLEIDDSQIDFNEVNDNNFRNEILWNFAPLVYQNKLFFNKYLYNFILESLFLRKFFLLKYLKKNLSNKVKWKTYQILSEQGI